MRIAFLNPTGELGGAERSLLDVLRSFRETCQDAKLMLVLGGAGPFADRALELGVETRTLPFPPALRRLGDTSLRSGWKGRAAGAARLVPTAFSSLGYAHALGRLLRGFEPDVVHSNGMKHHVLAALARPGAAPVVWHVQDLVGERPLMARALALLSRRAAGAIAISCMVQRDLNQHLPGLSVQVVYNTVDTAEFQPGPAAPSRLDELAGLPPAGAEAVRVGLVATYARWKGHDVFLEAAARLRPRLPQGRVRFYIVGGPIYETRGSQFSEPELRSLAARLGLEGAVGFVPFQLEPVKVIRALDIVVHASTRPEPFGRAIAEAMACARPVISTDSGAAELFPKDCGLPVLLPGDADALATAIGRLAQDPETRRRLGEVGRAIAVDRFSRARLAAHVLEAYARMGLVT